MRVREDVLVKHFTEAAIEQVAWDLREQGYQVTREVKLGSLVADLTARKDDELIVFEFKASSWDAGRIELARQLRNYAVHELRAEFRLVLVNVPREIVIEVDNLEQLLLDLVINEPALYDALATHAEIDEISDVEFDRVLIREDGIEIAGSAVVSVTLQYGSDRDVRQDIGLRTSDSFALNFHIVLDHNLQRVIERIVLESDASDYYM